MTICDKFESVLSRFDVVTTSDDQFQIRCPAHEDRSPSMVVKVSEDG